tara:strand:+ start:83 stop:1576 length:1494 start_codon:yes stop_codon:yes gene_type:complete
MIAKKLLTTIAIAIIVLFSGCANDDFVGVNGLCPVVESTIPADGTINVPLNQVISATFNEKMNPTTISQTSFTVAANGTLINGTVTYNNLTATFTPNPLLSDDTEYTGTITTLAKDERGNALQEDYVWTFTTGISVPTFSVEVLSNPTDGGLTSGAGPYDQGTSAIVLATPNAGYEFTSWSGDATGTDNPLTVLMDADKIITANFILIGTGFSLNVTAINGSVSKNPNQLSYNNGDNVILTPTPDSGYVFDSWSGDATGTDNPLTVLMDADKNITANFLLTTATGSYPLGVDLGSAGDFAILGGSGVSNTGVSTVITGDVGSFPTATINGLLPSNVIGTLYTSADPIVGLAKDDLTTAYNDAQSRSTDAISLPGQLGGLTLAPGLYVNSSTSGISGTGPNGILTLDAGGDANAVWIFKMGSTLITDAGTSIVLAGGAQASNIYWSVGTSATLGTNSIFYGNILADQAITLTTGAVLNGRALTRIAEVTLDTNTVTKP